MVCLESRASPRQRGLLAGTNAGRAPRRVVVRQQHVERRRHEVRIADVDLLVQPGDLHRLRRDADVFGAVVPKRDQVEALEDAQHLGDHDPAGRRRRHRDAAAAILDLERRMHSRSEAGEVGRRQQAAMCLHVGHDPARDLPLVEAVDALSRDLAERAREVLVAHRIADPLRRAVGAHIERPAVRRGGELRRIWHSAVGALIGHEHAGDVRTDQPALGGNRDRRLDQPGPCEAAEPAMGIGEQAKYAGRGHGGVAELIDRAGQHIAIAVTALALEPCRPHLGGSARRTRGKAIEDDVPAGRRVEDLHHAEPADAAHHRVDHPLGEGAGEGCIYRIAAARKNGLAGFHRLRLWRYDHRPCDRQSAFWTRHRFLRRTAHRCAPPRTMEHEVRVRHNASKWPAAAHLRGTAGRAPPPHPRPIPGACCRPANQTVNVLRASWVAHLGDVHVRLQ